MAGDPDDSTGRGVVLESDSPREISREIALVNRARRERWPIPEDRRARLVDRLFAITEKESVTALDSTGTAVELEDVADKNAIAAAKVLVAMDSENAKQDPAPVEHHHTHELGPVTAENLEQHRQRLLERADRLGCHS